MARGYIDHHGQLITPDVVWYENEDCHDPSEEILAELGYLEGVLTDPPEPTGYESYYVEEDNKAVQKWRKVEYNPSVDERISAMENALLEMMGVDLGD